MSFPPTPFVLNLPDLPEIMFRHLTTPADYPAMLKIRLDSAALLPQVIIGAIGAAVSRSAPARASAGRFARDRWHFSAFWCSALAAADALSVGPRASCANVVVLLIVARCSEASTVCSPVSPFGFTIRSLPQRP